MAYFGDSEGVLTMTHMALYTLFYYTSFHGPFCSLIPYPPPDPSGVNPMDTF